MSTLITNQIQTTGGKPILNSTGSILQVGFAENSTQILAPAQTYTIICSVSITSIASNSKYFMTGYTHGYSATSGNRGNLGFSVTIGGTQTRLAGVDGTFGDSWGTISYNGTQYNRSFTYTSSAPAGTSLTFNLLGTAYDASVYWNWSGYNHKAAITVMEISA